MITLSETEILEVNGGVFPVWARGYIVTEAMNWMLKGIANPKNPGSWDDGSYFANLRVP
jgi:hypothetical protein